MARTKKTQPTRVQSLLHSVWFFPLILFVLVLLLTALKINGSSVNIYYQDLYGPNAHDSNLIAGSPRGIRSDEWEVQTNMTLAQVEARFPETNRNIGQGQNMETIVDAPYKDWSALFKPQNFLFFVLPVGFAFAFKWWLLAWLLITSVYFFILLLLPRKRLLAAILSTAFFFSPFIQWWYQTITLATLAYSFLLIVLTVKLWQSKGRAKLGWAALLTYVLSCFAIIFYPPFQIPCFIVTVMTTLAYFLDQKLFKQDFKRNFLYLLASGAVFVAIFGAYVATNRSSLEASRNSVYPGHRISTSGHFDQRTFFGNFLDSQLQLSRKALNYVANQSEASNFLLLAPFVSLPVIFWLVQKYRRSRKTAWLLLFSTGLFGLFMVRLFVPGSDVIFKPLLLENVPNSRLMIGIGMVAFVQVVAVIRFLQNNEVLYRRILAVVTGLLTLVVNLKIGFTIRELWPGYVHLVPLIVGLALIPAVIIYLLLDKRFMLAALGLLGFGLMSSAAVNPVYRGVGPLYKSAAVHSIQSVAQQNPNGRWVVVDNIVYENLPIMANVPSTTGLYAYPQLNYWSTAPELKAHSDVYNRYAHTRAIFTPAEAELRLKQSDFFEIVGSPCSTIYKELGVHYFFSEREYSQDYSCLKTLRKIDYPNKTFYISELQ